MKASLVFSVFCLASFVACSHSSTDAGFTPPPLPPLSAKAAAGAINGQTTLFLGGSYAMAKDSKGNPVYQIYLTANAADSCTMSANGVYITAPAKIGQYGFPQSYVMFVYTKGTETQNDITGSEMVKITSDDGVKVTGAVVAQMGGSVVNGTFEVTQCGQQTAPVLQPTPPVGATDPAQVTAVPAQSWSDVKYAFCSAQGQNGILIDFQGVDLSTATQGEFKMGVRQCGSTQPFQWGGPAAFSVTKSGTTVTLDFGQDANVGTENTIQIDSNDFVNGNGVMGGNSGPCTLLSNEGTQGLFQGQPDFACQ